MEQRRPNKVHTSTPKFGCRPEPTRPNTPYFSIMETIRKIAIPGAVGEKPTKAEITVYDQSAQRRKEVEDVKI